VNPRLAAIALITLSVLGVACQKNSDTKNGTVNTSSSTTSTTEAPSTTATTAKAAPSTTATTAKATTTTTVRAATTTTTRPALTTTTAKTVSYANCTAVKNAGKAPLYAGQPGYSTDLDRDRDGVACES
jgi:uncharacterized membrane protein